MRETLIFWLLFLVLNSFYFWPRYILESGRSAFFPLKGFTEGKLKRRFRYFAIRLNYDILRVSVDFLLIMVLYVVWLKNYVEPFDYWIFATAFYGFNIMFDRSKNMIVCVQL